MQRGSGGLIVKSIPVQTCLRAWASHACLQAPPVATNTVLCSTDDVDAPRLAPWRVSARIAPLNRASPARPSSRSPGLLPKQAQARAMIWGVGEVPMGGGGGEELARLKAELELLDKEMRDFLAPLLRYPPVKQMLLSFLRDDSR
jgi:hypothetical protein